MLTTLGTAFNNIQNIHGELQIQNNPLLTNFEALRGLQCHGSPSGNGTHYYDQRTNCVNCPDWLKNLPRCEENCFQAGQC